MSVDNCYIDRKVVIWLGLYRDLPVALRLYQVLSLR